MTTRETEGQVCLWCGDKMPNRERPRGSARKFCDDSCRHQHRSALCRLGQETANEKFPAQGALRTWSKKARALLGDVKSDDLVSTPIADAPVRSGPSYGFVQFGHFWFVVDGDGQRVSAPLKTPEAVQRRARRMTEAAVKNRSSKKGPLSSLSCG